MVLLVRQNMFGGLSLGNRWSPERLLYIVLHNCHLHWTTSWHIVAPLSTFVSRDRSWLWGFNFSSSFGGITFRESAIVDINLILPGRGQPDILTDQLVKHLAPKPLWQRVQPHDSAALVLDPISNIVRLASFLIYSTYGCPEENLHLQLDVLN